MASFAGFIEQNLWVPVVVAICLAVIIALLVWWCRLGRYRDGYTRLEGGEAGLVQHLSLAKFQRSADKEVAAMHCRYYLRSSPQYELIQQLSDIGSRVQKNWFATRATGLDDQLLILVPRSSKCTVPFNRAIRKALISLFEMLSKHPFVYGMTDVDFLADQGQVVLLQSLSVTGSLKDVIYKAASPIKGWGVKYKRRCKGLPLRRIGVYGRQILEALQFLRLKKLPYGHLHSGNVIIYNDVCQITGIENTILGYKSRLHKLVRPFVKKETDPDAVDIACFGHVLFEMAMGYELETTAPDVDSLVGKCPFEVIEALALIFHNESGMLPTLQNVINQPLFLKSTPKEVEGVKPPTVMFTGTMKEIIRSVRQQRPFRSKSTRRKSGMSAETSFSSGPGSPRVSAPTSPVSRRSSVSVPPTPVAAPPAPPAPAAAPPAPRAPAAAAPPPKAAAPAGAPGRNALLDSIRKGRSLNKAVTVDKSKPRL